MENGIITIEEAIEMQGTEFYYYFSDGDRIKAYVKKFDPKVGLTCMSLETKTAEGWTGNLGMKKEEDGTWCVIGHDFKKGGPESLKKALRKLTEIKETGEYYNNNNGHGGNANCAFA